MAATLGDLTKTTFYKGVEAHKLHEEFEVEGLKHTLTFDGALVALNQVDGFVGPNAIAPVVFATDSDTTMAALATTIAAMPGVSSATVITVAAGTDNDRVIEIVPEDQLVGLSLTSFAVTLGAGQAAIAAATINRKIFMGMPVEINPTSGKVQPVTVATHDLTCIGYTIHSAVAGELATIAVRGYVAIYAEAIAAAVHGPVKFSSYDVVNEYNKVSSDTVTTANQMGWALDDAAADLDLIRVILK